MSSKIAVIMPAYKAEKTLKRAIRSVQRQTVDWWELVVINDGSPDRTGEIAEQLAKQDSRIHIIHQDNKGSVEARKAGVFSSIAQQCKYLTFLDADDELMSNAFEAFLPYLESNIDIVVGRTEKYWRRFIIKGGYISPCMSHPAARQYTHHEIINELLIGYFGKTDFPVSLFAKAYRIELITNAVNHPPIVKFMGEDLSVTIRAVTEANRLIIISDVVYKYQIGGETSRFMPEMMDDFLALYTFKREFAMKYPMPQDWQYLMDVELLNTTKTHFQQCMKSNTLSNSQLKKEIIKVCSEKTVRNVATKLKDINKGISDYADMVYKEDVEKIIAFNVDIIKQQMGREIIKKILYQL